MRPPEQWRSPRNVKAMGGDQFTYDKVSRLMWSSQEIEPSVIKSRAYAYDAFGNMTTMTLEDTSVRSFNIVPASNRIANAPCDGCQNPWTASYDEAGNQEAITNDTGATSTFTWYATGAMKQGTFASGGRTMDHAYDADGERAAVEDSGLLGTHSGIRVSLRGLDNKVRRGLIAWHDGAGWRWEWQRDTEYRGGQLLAAISSNPSGVVRHYTLDHLGTPRL